MCIVLYKIKNKKKKKSIYQVRSAAARAAVGVTEYNHAHCKYLIKKIKPTEYICFTFLDALLYVNQRNSIHPLVNPAA